MKYPAVMNGGFYKRMSTMKTNVPFYGTLPDFSNLFATSA
jgi:hypothetical protein